MKKFAFLLTVLCVGGAFAVPSSGFAAPLTIATKGDQMLFDKGKLTVKKGATVKLTFTNKAAKNSGMQHNWVLTNPGTSDAVGQAGIAAGPDKSYVPDLADVLAHTKMLQPGESATIEFKAPEKPGQYPYVCTFPGHYAVMKGILEVK